MSRLVLVSAAPFETNPLVSLLEREGVPFTRITCGVGLVEAVRHGESLRSLVHNRHVIFVGTGGLIGAQFSKPALYQIQSIRLAPFDVRNAHTELLTQFDFDISFKNSLNLNLPTAPSVGSLGISVTNELSANPVLSLETMELYGVARSWIHHAKTFTPILAATNETGPRARDQWRNHFMAAAEQTALHLSLIIQELNKQGAFL